MTLPTSIRNHRLPIAILFLFGCVLIFFEYQNIPKYMTFDEIEFAKLALSLDKTGYAPYSTYATGHATLYFYVILFSFKIFGITKLGLRLPSAIFGILNPIILYLILQQIQKISKKRISELFPFLSGLLFLTSRWYFNFARFGFEATFLLFWELLALLFAFLFIRKKRFLYIILSGIFSGLAYNSYQPGRLFFIIPALVIFCTDFKYRGLKTLLPDAIRHKLAIRKSLVLYIFPFLIVIAPLTLYLLQNPDIRMYQLFYPGNHETSLPTKCAWFWENVVKTFNMFFFQGDMNGRHNYTGKAALNPIMSVLFIAGLTISFIRRRQWRYSWVFIFWLGLSLIPTLLTYPWENPNMLRTVTVTPAVAYFAGAAVLWLFEKIQSSQSKIKASFLLILFSVVTVSVAYEIRTYFLYQSRVFLESFEAKKELIYYINHPDKSVFEK